MLPDLQTTMLLTGLIFGIVSAFMISGAFTLRAKAEGRLEWGLGYAAIFAGSLILSVAYEPRAFFLLCSGNGFMLFGFAAVATGLGRFASRRARAAYVLAAAGAVLIAILTASSLNLGIAAYSAFIAAISMIGAIAIRPDRRKEGTGADRGFLSLSFVLLALLCAVKLVAIGLREIVDWSEPPALNATLIAGGSCVLLLQALVLERLIGDRRRAELDRALGEKELLFRELNHRTKNDLLLVDSLIALRAASSGDSLSAAEVRELRSRIQSIAIAHDSLSVGAKAGAIRLDDYLSLVLDSMPIAGTGSELERDFRPVEILAAKAVPVGLLVNELVTNSFKHASSPGVPGRIRVSLRSEGDEVFISVADQGPGTSWPPERAGLGYAIVQGLADQLGGRLEARAGSGATLELRFPRS